MTPLPAAMKAVDRAPAVLLALGIVSRLLWLAFVHPEPVVDFAYYYNRAVEQSRGYGYNWMGHPTAYYPVGTSSLLAAVFLLFGPSVLTAQVAATAAGFATITLVYLLARQLGTSRAALWAAALLAIDPDLIVTTGLVASENFYLPALLGALMLLVRALEANARWPWLALSGGLLFGVSLLVRSTGVILVPLVLLIFVFRSASRWRRGLMDAAAFSVAAAIVVGPWIVRNAEVLGEPVLSTNGGIALWWGNNPHASGGFPLSIDNPTQDLSSVAAELKSNRDYSRQAKAFMVAHPGRWLALAVPKLSYLFMPVASDLGFWTLHRHIAGPGSIDVDPVHEPARAARVKTYETRPLTPVENRMIGAYYHLSPAGTALGAIIWVLGLLGLGLMCRHREHAAPTALLLLSVAGWVLFHITFGNGQPRYLMPMVPVLTVGTGWCMAALIDRLERR